MLDGARDIIDVPNLDTCTTRPTDLEDISRVYSILAAYAEHKAKGMRHRLNGDIECAISFEKAAQTQYRLLPKWARW